MLKDIRQKAGKTQKEVAEALNVKQTTYSSWETGRSAIPKLQQAALADYFDVPMNEIVATPANTDALSEDEKKIIKMKRQNYSFDKAVHNISHMYWLVSNLDGGGDMMANVTISQLVESYDSLLGEYYNHYQLKSFGRIANQKLENAKQLAKAATEEFEEFVENEMQEYVSDVPF